MTQTAEENRQWIMERLARSFIRQGFGAGEAWRRAELLAPAPAPDAVLSAMETETDPLPDCVAAAWDVELDPPDDEPDPYPFCDTSRCPWWRGYCSRDPSCDN